MAKIGQHRHHPAINQDRVAEKLHRSHGSLNLTKNRHLAGGLGASKAHFAQRREGKPTRNW